MALSNRYDNMVERLSRPPEWRSRSDTVSLKMLACRYFHSSGHNFPRSKILLEPYTYVTSTGGKQIRTHLMDAFNQWLDIPSPRLEVIARIVSMLHNASLL